MKKSAKVILNVETKSEIMGGVKGYGTEKCV